MSVPSIELWRPLRDRTARWRRRVAIAAAATVLAGTLLDALLLRLPSVFMLGVAEALVFLLAYRVARQNPSRWGCSASRHGREAGADPPPSNRDSGVQAATSPGRVVAISGRERL